MGEENGFQLRRSDLETADFDEFLLAVDDVPFTGDGGAVSYISRLEESFAVEGFRICGRVARVARDHDRAAHAEFAVDVITGDIFSFFVDDSGNEC